MRRLREAYEMSINKSEFNVLTYFDGWVGDCIIAIEEDQEVNMILCKWYKEKLSVISKTVHLNWILLNSLKA